MLSCINQNAMHVISQEVAVNSFMKELKECSNAVRNYKKCILYTDTQVMYEPVLQIYIHKAD